MTDINKILDLTAEQIDALTQEAFAELLKAGGCAGYNARDESRKSH